jgi:hypothetical protein
MKVFLIILHKIYSINNKHTSQRKALTCPTKLDYYMEGVKRFF